MGSVMKTVTLMMQGQYSIVQGNVLQGQYLMGQGHYMIVQSQHIMIQGK